MLLTDTFIFGAQSYKRVSDESTTLFTGKIQVPNILIDYWFLILSRPEYLLNSLIFFVSRSILFVLNVKIQYDDNQNSHKFNYGLKA